MMPRWLTLLPNSFLHCDSLLTYPMHAWNFVIIVDDYEQKLLVICLGVKAAGQSYRYS